MKYLAFLLLTVVIGRVFSADGGKYNISFAGKLDYSRFLVLFLVLNRIFLVLDHCTQYLANIGYNYRHFFKISDLRHATPKENELLRLNLVILGQKDAHILLTSSTENQPDMAVYEIGKILHILRKLFKN